MGQAKRLLRRGFSAAVRCSGYPRLRACVGDAARILCYHNISEESPDRFSVSPHEFEQQMRHLDEKYRVLSIEEIVGDIRCGVPIAQGTVAVTFDDGYLGAYTYGFPVLERLSIPATIFLATAATGNSQATPAPGSWARDQFMTWSDVRSMAGDRIRFGSHSISHTSLRRLRPDEIRAEISRSRAVIEEATGLGVEGFAYPYGLPRDYRGVDRYVSDAGYSWAVTGVHGANGMHTNPYLLKRTKVERGDSLEVFDRLLQGAMDPWCLFDLIRR